MEQGGVDGLPFWSRVSTCNMPNFWVIAIRNQQLWVLAIPLHSIKALTSSIDWMAGVGRMMIGENGSDVSVSGYDGWIGKEIEMNE